jgi:hypothetical protein
MKFPRGLYVHSDFQLVLAPERVHCYSLRIASWSDVGVSYLHSLILSESEIIICGSVLQSTFLGLCANPFTEVT